MLNEARGALIKSRGWVTLLTGSVWVDLAEGLYVGARNPTRRLGLCQRFTIIEE